MKGQYMPNAKMASTISMPMEPGIKTTWAFGVDEEISSYIAQS
ncbi:Unknown protein sequence [Pseudomonas amygdali pv. lachrymans]|uniref:Coenzyme PQQ synthesis protein A n=1 Tax=Pseudomonas amygdali pv. lachrymans TaxID=53707 RepID=A0ABR5KRB4_PSEAV|nr:Unknown protein sequence [Pseudomonas amygdali pv. lachrymans]